MLSTIRSIIFVSLLLVAEDFPCGINLLHTSHYYKTLDVLNPPCTYQLKRRGGPFRPIPIRMVLFREAVKRFLDLLLCRVVR